jgi:hypothetical protein
MVTANMTPTQLRRIYDGGFIGCYVDDPELPMHYRRVARYGRAQLLEQLLMPKVEDFASEIEGVGDGQLATPWHAYLNIDPAEAMKGNQLTGDCTSWATRCAVDIERCCAILAGESEDYIAQLATAIVYGNRGHGGQGMSVARAAQGMKDNGLAIETEYLDGRYDFRNYKDYYQLGMKWGRRGIPADLLEITRKNRVKTISSVNTLEAVRDLTQTGRAVSVGSMIGVASTGDPVSRLKGSWSHAMTIVGHDSRPETVRKFGSRLYFWDQSWGDWNRLTGLLPEWGDFGQGMFVLNERDTWKAVRSGDCWTFTETDGFPNRKLNWLLI